MPTVPPSAPTIAEREPVTKMDGRRTRRDRNHEIVLDTVRKLFAEEMLFPTVEAVAQRSGVSVRSLYRHFEDPGSLVSAAVQRSMQLGSARARIPSFGQGSFEERLRRFVEVRVTLFEHEGSGFRVARVHAPDLPALRDALDTTRRFLREQVDGQFATELRALPRRERFFALSACDTASQFDSLDYLRRDRHVTVAECKEILARTFERNLRA